MKFVARKNYVPFLILTVVLVVLALASCTTTTEPTVEPTAIIIVVTETPKEVVVDPPPTPIIHDTGEVDVEKEEAGDSNTPSNNSQNKPAAPQPEEKKDEPVQTCSSYVVESGDTLFRISQAYDVTVEMMVKVNNIDDASRIATGQSLLIPCGARIPPQFPPDPPVNVDDDNDGLTNAEEKELGTNASDSDSDNDDLTDGQEVYDFGTDPLSWDTDGDEVADTEELFKYGTNPLTWDSDSDEISDGEEMFVYDTNPNAWDSDDDGVSDYDELFYTNTDANYWDSDSDAVSDYDELYVYATNALVWDTDGDDLSDADELFSFGTDALSWDTDWDGLGDGEEVSTGTDPLDAYDPPARVNGWQATEVSYSSGSFVMTGGGEWVEYNNDGAHYFQEVGRDEWSVYLQATDRDNVSIQLDLWTMEVKYSGPDYASQIVLYSITGAW